MSAPNQHVANSPLDAAPGPKKASQPPRAGQTRPSPYEVRDPSRTTVSRSYAVEPDRPSTPSAGPPGSTLPVVQTAIGQPAAQTQVQPPALPQSGPSGAAVPMSGPTLESSLKSAIEGFSSFERFLAENLAAFNQHTPDVQFVGLVNDVSSALRRVYMRWYDLINGSMADASLLIPRPFHEALSREQKRADALVQQIEDMRKRYPEPDSILREVQGVKASLNALKTSIKSLVDRQVTYADAVTGLKPAGPPSTAVPLRAAPVTPQKRPPPYTLPAPGFAEGPAPKKPATEVPPRQAVIPEGTSWQVLAQAAAVGCQVDDLSVTQAIAVANLFGVPPAPGSAPLPPAASQGSAEHRGATPVQSAKPKPNPVPHVRPPRDHGRLLVARFARRIDDQLRRSFDDIKSWLDTLLKEKAEPPVVSATQLVSVQWDVGGTSLYLRFASRPPVSAQRLIDEHAAWLASPPPDGPVEVTVDFYTPVTLLEVNAVRRVEGSRDLSMEEIYAKIQAGNPHLGDYLVPCIHPPRPFWRAQSGGSGTLVIAVYDDKKGSHSRSFVKKPFIIDGVEHHVALYAPPPVNAFCHNCFRWNHTRRRCKAKVEFCARCGGSHVTSLHNRLGLCCAERRAELQCAEVECLPDHDFCPNCGLHGHVATSRKCVYFRHRFSKEWLRAHPPKYPADVVRRANTYKGFKARPVGSGASAPGDADVDMEGATSSGRHLEDSQGQESDVEQVAWGGLEDADDHAPPRSA